jgi:hypothetical protein
MTISVSISAADTTVVYDTKSVAYGTPVSFVASYNGYGGGDVIFGVVNSIPECAGYWITKDDPGFKANLSMLLSAYLTKVPVEVYASPDQLWSGSTAPHCKVYSFRML